MADRSSRRANRSAKPYDRPKPRNAPARERSVIGWMGETVRDMFAAPSWMADMWSSPVTQDTKRTQQCDDSEDEIEVTDAPDRTDVPDCSKVVTGMNSESRELDIRPIVKTSTCDNANVIQQPLTKKSRVSFLDSPNPQMSSRTLHSSFLATDVLSQSFTPGFGSITPQRPLAQSMFYNHPTRYQGNDTSLLELSTSQNSEVFDSQSPKNRLDSSYMSKSTAAETPSSGKKRQQRLIRRNSSALPLSGNAARILKKLEQPLSISQIASMNSLRSIPSEFSRFSDRTDSRDEIKSADSIQDGLPSFSFISNKKAQKTSLPAFHPPCVKPRAPVEDVDEISFTFSEPKPKNFSFDLPSSPLESGIPSTMRCFPPIVPPQKTVDKADDVQEPTANKAISHPNKLSQMFKPAEGSWSCDVCLVSNKPGTNKCAACESPKPNQSSGSTNLPSTSLFNGKPEQPKTMWSFGQSNWNNGTAAIESHIESGSKSQQKISLLEKFKPKEGSWSCDVCLVSNTAECQKCAACETPKTSSATALENGAKPQPKSLFLTEKFKPKEGSWSCDVCLVSNTADCQKCAACETPKPSAGPGQKPEVVSSTPNLLAQMFKPSTDTWECGVCLVRNKNSDTSCAACGEKNPKAPSTQKEEKVTTTEFKFSSDSSSTQFTFGKSISSSSAVNGSHSGVANGSAFTFGKPPNNNAEPPPPPFKFGSSIFGNGGAANGPSSFASAFSSTNTTKANFTFGSS